MSISFYDHIIHSAVDVHNFMDSRKAIIQGRADDNTKDHAAEEIAWLAHMIVLRGTEEEKQTFRQLISSDHTAAAAQRLTRPEFSGLKNGTIAFLELVRASKGNAQMLGGYTIGQLASLLDTLGPVGFTELVRSIGDDVASGSGRG